MNKIDSPLTSTRMTTPATTYAVNQPIPIALYVDQGQDPIGGEAIFRTSGYGPSTTNAHTNQGNLSTAGGVLFKPPLTGRVTNTSFTFTLPGQYYLKFLNINDLNNYSCDGNFLRGIPHVCAATHYINIVLEPSRTTLTPSAPSAQTGSPFTLTAVIDQATSPTGTVTFFDGGAAIGVAPVNGGSAVLATSFGTAGAHALHAVYSGDQNNTTSTSATISVPVTLYIDPDLAMVKTFEHDANGNLKSVADSTGAASTFGYNELNQLTQRSVPIESGASASSSSTVNKNDSVQTVIDPRGNPTGYTRDGLGRELGSSSPDAGSTILVRNAKGQVTSMTDARDKVKTVTYDAEGRLKDITYSSGVATVLEYDGGATPVAPNIGKLTRVIDESGSTIYSWNQHGRLVSKAQTTNGRVFSQAYTYVASGNGVGELASITYPGKARVNYGYDTQGRVNAISVNPVQANGSAPDTATSIPVLSDITYDALGKVAAWTWGGGATYARTFDQFGRPKTYPLGNEAGSGAAAGLLRTLNYDNDGRIISMAHTRLGAAQPSFDKTFAYDLSSKLKEATIGSTFYAYGYDLNANRTVDRIGTSNYTNVIAGSSNRLTTDGTSTGTYTLTYDAAGNVLTDGYATYTYSDRGRMATARVGNNTATYKYNAFDQRTSKLGPTSMVSTGAAYYIYQGVAGFLAGEYDTNSIPISETLYLGDTPVAVLKYTRTGNRAPYTWAMTVSYVYADHLDTPRVIVRSSDHAIQWRWDSAEPFGATVPNQNPSGLGAFVFNQRFPGQLYDAETGNFQNWHRDYNPRTGRYLQSDPIGLQGGINTYAYANGNPISNIDPLGLWSVEFGGYAGVGFTVTFGQNPNGSGFASLKVGFGLGAGASFDPLGQQAGYMACQCRSWTGGLGLFAEAGVHAGIAQLGGTLDAGKTKNSCGTNSFFDKGIKNEFSGLGMKGIAAGGIKASIGGGGSAVGGCTC